MAVVTTAAAITTAVASGIKFFVSKSKQAEKERLEATVRKMISGNWFKVKEKPSGELVGRGNFSDEAGSNYYGVKDALSERGLPAKFYPLIIAKIDRYIKRQPQNCKGKSGGAKRACERYTEGARIVKKLVTERAKNMQKQGGGGGGALQAGIGGNFSILAIGALAIVGFYIYSKK